MIYKYNFETPQKRKNNYPKNRKKGVNKNSQKYKLLEKYSLKHIQQTWVEFGMYEGAKRLGYSNPFVLYHLAKEKGWKRILPQHLIKAYNEGCWKITDRYYIERNNKIMCKAVKITDNNAVENEKLKKLQLILGKDSYKEILKLNNGQPPDIVRKYELIFHTQDSDEVFESALSIENDEINFAYIPIDLLPGPKDQNLFTFFSLTKNDFTNQGIIIPENDGYHHYTKASWKDIIKYFREIET